MRGILLTCMMLLLACPPGVCPAQTALAAPPVAAAATPAKGTASAIIPGSPLAALTGVAPVEAPADAPSPFGTGTFGLSIANAIDREVAGTAGAFLAAVQRSTALTPVLAWAGSFATVPARGAHALNALMGLGITMIPALLVEAAIRLGVSRPRAALAGRAARLPLAPAAPPDPPGEAPPEGLADAEAGETELSQPRRRDSVMSWLWRCGLALLDLALALLPVLGFAIAIATLLSLGVITTREARLAVNGVANAYIAFRLALKAIRFVLAPQAPPLRLVHTSTARASWACSWAAIVLGSIATGYGVVTVAEILGLAPEGGIVLARLVALAVHIELAFAIWQSRHVVAGWIRGHSETGNFTGGLRARLARIWHFLALFYVLALWIAYAGGVHNAFGVLLRIVLVFVVALVLGRAAWAGCSHVLDRLFPDSDDPARNPKLAARARAYNPLVRLLIRVMIGFAVLVMILQGWGIGALPWLLADPISRALLSAFLAIIITIAIALVVWEITNSWFAARIERLSGTGRVRQASRLRTVLPMLRATIGVVIGLVAGLICLSKIGVNAAPLLAGAGVVGIAVGFGSQKLVQDIITGLFLLLEDAMQVGDVITLAGMSGTVERLSIRTIRLRGGDGSINIIPFSAVTTVTNMTRDFGYAQISITVSYRENIDHVREVLLEIGRRMRAEPEWAAMMRGDVEIFGLDEFGATGLVILGQIRTGPGQHWAIRREFYGRVQKRFAELGIEMAYTHQTLSIEGVGLLPLAAAPPPDAGQAGRVAPEA
jgi:small conductance mechanosensitive channel